MTWWDYKSGLPFETMQDLAQPGSLDAEAGSASFDFSPPVFAVSCRKLTLSPSL